MKTDAVDICFFIWYKNNMFPRAKKSFGQNFLKSDSALDKIIDAAHLSPSDTVLEIGPGTGVLTRKLLNQGVCVLAVEKDRELVELLQQTFESADRLTIISGDILTFDPQTLPTSYKLVANIPYNITGAIIEKFLSTPQQPTTMVLMVQKEVAERIIARDKKTGNSGKESILSIAVKAYSTPRYVATVKAGNFVPAPSVDSAIIACEHISRNNFPTKHHEEVFFQLVKTGFAHKRKTLTSNLKTILEPELVKMILEQNHLQATIRAEDLGITDWISLTNMVYTETYGTPQHPCV